MNRTAVVIANAASLSGATQLQAPSGNNPAWTAIVIPATWTAANLTFQVSHDGGTTYNDMYDKAGAEVTVTVGAASRYIILDPQVFAGISDFKIRSGTAATPVAQGGARTLVVVSAGRL